MWKFATSNAFQFERGQICKRFFQIRFCFQKTRSNLNLFRFERVFCFVEESMLMLWKKWQIRTRSNLNAFEFAFFSIQLAYSQTQNKNVILVIVSVSFKYQVMQPIGCQKFCNSIALLKRSAMFCRHSISVNIDGLERVHPWSQNGFPEIGFNKYAVMRNFECMIRLIGYAANRLHEFHQSKHSVNTSGWKVFTR